VEWAEPAGRPELAEQPAEPAELAAWLRPEATVETAALGAAECLPPPVPASPALVTSTAIQQSITIAIPTPTAFPSSIPAMHAPPETSV